jgi:hypothetical protein
MTRIGTRIYAALATPLMVYLARTVYSDIPRHKPADLLNESRFPTPESIERYLLRNFVPAVYQRPSPDGSVVEKERSWENPFYWHTYLATYLARTNTQDLVWWQISEAISPTLRRLVRGFLAGVLFGSAIVFGGSELEPLGATSLMDESVLKIAAIAIGLGLLGFALITIRSKITRNQASSKNDGWGALAWGQMETLTLECAGLLTGLLSILLITGIQAGLFLGVHSWPMPPCPDGLCRKSIYFWLYHSGDTTSYYLAVALWTGLKLGLIVWLLSRIAAALEKRPEIDTAPTPRDLIRMSRNHALRIALIATLVFGFWAVIGNDLRSLPSAFAVGMVFVLYTKWGNWLLFTRWWLSVNEKLPWALLAFLEDAARPERGVLRQAGGVYQYRHIQLRDQLCSITIGIRIASRNVEPKAKRIKVLVGQRVNFNVMSDTEDVLYAPTVGDGYELQIKARHMTTDGFTLPARGTFRVKSKKLGCTVITFKAR